MFERALTVTVPLFAVTLAPVPRNPCVLPLIVDSAWTTAVATPMPTAIATASVSAWTTPSKRAPTRTSPLFDVTVAPVTFAETVLPIVFVVSETAPATAIAPPESEIDGSTAAMLDVSLAVMLTSPSDVTTAELPM